MRQRIERRWFGLGCATMVLGPGGCEKPGSVSEARAREHVTWLEEAVKRDVEEVRKGLPEGARHLVSLFQRDRLGPEDAEEARSSLTKARSAVQDLRVAKSTFFAAVRTDGLILRNDREQDLMAGKNIFSAFPELKQAVSGLYVETHGTMLEAAGTRGRPDGQWVAAAPVRVGEEVKGLYVTGWAWSSYAYRLEFALRNELRGQVGKGIKEPLTYVFVLVRNDVYGAPLSPQVTATELAKLRPLEKISNHEIFSQQQEITSRLFGLAVKRMEVLGPEVGVAVVRSET